MGCVCSFVRLGVPWGSCRRNVTLGFVCLLVSWVANPSWIKVILTRMKAVVPHVLRRNGKIRFLPQVFSNTATMQLDKKIAFFVREHDFYSCHALIRTRVTSTEKERHTPTFPFSRLELAAQLPKRTSFLTNHAGNFHGSWMLFPPPLHKFSRPIVSNRTSKYPKKTMLAGFSRFRSPSWRTHDLKKSDCFRRFNLGWQPSQIQRLRQTVNG